MRSLSLLPCSYTINSSLYKDKPTKPRGKHHLLVLLKLRPVLLSVAAVCIWFSVIGLVQIHETLNVAIRVTSAPNELKIPVQPKLIESVQHRLLLATHNVLAWYYPQYDTMEVIHKGQGVHYGMFPGDPEPGHPSTVWNIIRPHNWRPTTEQEYLVKFDSVTGKELQRIVIPSRFSHDAIRVGNYVYVCSTGDGNILQLSYPDMRLVQSHKLFSVHDHPNTLAAVGGTDGRDHLWVLLHNLGASDLVKVYVGTDRPAYEVLRIKGVGTKAHGIVSWGSAGDLIMLDSENGILVSLNTETGSEYELWKVPEGGKFLKGLAVLDDIAYFGIAVWSERSVRDSPDSAGELAAFDLVKNKLLWRRQVPTQGLLNIIGAPHLAVDSTYVATYTPTTLPTSKTSGLTHAGNNSPGLVLPDSKALTVSALKTLESAGFTQPSLDPVGYWSSGWPRLDTKPKLTDHPEVAGLQLPLFHAEIAALKERILALPDVMWTKEYQAVNNAVMSGRTSNMEKFKPGVEGMVLLFSDNGGEVVYQFPFYELFREELEPLLKEILGPVDVHNIVRIQFAKMAPGTSDIKMHVDSGGYAKLGHRIHVPIVTNRNVAFDLCPYQLQGRQLPNDGSAPPGRDSVVTAAAAAVRAAAILPVKRQQEQQQKQQQQQMAAKQLPPDETKCVKIPAPEGLAFELNNRVPHKVSNPGPGIRIHLVIDVFEEHKTRTKVPPGSHCEYGQIQTGLIKLTTILQQLQQGLVTPDRLVDEIQVLLTSPGMTCTTPDGLRIVPKVDSKDPAALEQMRKRQDEVMEVLMAALPPQLQQQVATELARVAQQLGVAQALADPSSGVDHRHQSSSQPVGSVAGVKPYDAARAPLPQEESAADSVTADVGSIEPDNEEQVGGRKVVGGYYEFDPDGPRVPQR